MCERLPTTLRRHLEVHHPHRNFSVLPPDSEVERRVRFENGITVVYRRTPDHDWRPLWPDQS